MVIKYVIFLTLCTGLSKTQDPKWVWGENGRNNGLRREGRYDVYENGEPDHPYGISNEPLGFNGAPGPFNGGPAGFQGSSGLYGGGNGAPLQRPGGLYHNPESLGNYGPYNPYREHESEPAILAGPDPGASRNFDRCKCTEKFNCPSPGFSYGHCDKGKQYCCYDSKKGPAYHGDRDLLVGGGGRPFNGGFHGGYPEGGNRPGLISHRPHGDGGYRRPGNYGNKNIYSPANGILVGPGYRP